MVDLVLVSSEEDPFAEADYESDGDGSGIALSADEVGMLRDLGYVAGPDDARTAAERAQLGQWSESAVAYPRDSTVVEQFARQVAARPDAPALEDEGETSRMLDAAPQVAFRDAIMRSDH